MKVWNREEVVDLYQQGYSCRAIRDMLSLDVSIRALQKIVAKAGVSRAYNKSGRLDIGEWGSSTFRDIVLELMVARGDDPYLCGQCHRRLTKYCDIHHTKYENATLADLMFLCRRCNTQPQNKGLA